MTVIIRGLDKPKECLGCQFCLKDHGRDYCIFDGEYINWEDGTINPDCPVGECEGLKWIPVTEKYPLPWELVWVTDRLGETNVCQMSHKDNQDWYDEEEDWMYEHDAIVAWMPYYVPEPYGGKS